MEIFSFKLSQEQYIEMYLWLKQTKIKYKTGLDNFGYDKVNYLWQLYVRSQMNANDSYIGKLTIWIDNPQHAIMFKLRFGDIMLK
jgi:hypothetical protein